MPHRPSFVGFLGVGLLGVVCVAPVLLVSRVVEAAPHRVTAHPRRTADATADGASREAARDRAEAAASPTSSPTLKRHRKSRRAEPRAASGSAVESRGAKSSPESGVISGVIPSGATPSAARSSNDAPVRGVNDVAPSPIGSSAKTAPLPNSAVAKSITAKSSVDVVPADVPRGSVELPRLPSGSRVARAVNDSSSNGGATPASSGSSAASSATALSRADLAGSGVPLRRDIVVDPPAALLPRVVTVSLDPLVFDHDGDVPRAAAALERLKGAFLRCATSDAAVLRADASVDLRFLVRAPGRAEGVDVEKVRGVSGDVVRCVSSALSRAYVGAPSDDPVGVSVSIHFRKD